MSAKKKSHCKMKACHPPEKDLGSGTPPKQCKTENIGKYPFRCGDKVACLLGTDCLRKMQEEHGYWDPKMEEIIGKTGIVHGITDGGGIKAHFGRDTRWTFHPGALTKLNTFEVDDAVRVINDVETVQKLQSDHKKWKKEMAAAVGQIGKVMKTCEDGDVRVQFQDRSWIFNPACLTLYRRNRDADFGTRQGIKGPKSKPAQLQKKDSIKRSPLQPMDEVIDYLDINFVNNIPEINIVKKKRNTSIADAAEFSAVMLHGLVCLMNGLGKAELSKAGHDERTAEMASVEEQSTDSTEVLLADSPTPSVEKERSEILEQQEKSNPTVCKRFLKDFKEITEIGSGGYGTVFKAQHCIDKMYYAIKRVTLSADGGKVEREVQALAKLDHENIVRYNTCWSGDDVSELEDNFQDTRSGDISLYSCIFIQMEYCGNGTLECWIDKKNRTPSYGDDGAMKFQQIVKGVAYIHAQNLIHRDLKPANIFISSQDRIKIGDFGLVTSGRDDLLAKRTKRKGTKSYMAPEQVGDRYGKEVDLFPLGLIWFEMLYRFGSTSEKSKKWNGIRECKFPPEFTKTFSSEASIIKEILSKEPSKRPSADVLLELVNKNICNFSQQLAKYVKTQSEALID